MKKRYPKLVTPTIHLFSKDDLVGLGEGITYICEYMEDASNNTGVPRYELRIKELNGRPGNSHWYVYASTLNRWYKEGLLKIKYRR